MLKEYNGKTYEFPDDATPQEINIAFKSLSQPQYGQVGKDIYNKAFESLIEAPKNIIGGLINIPSAIGYAQENPYQAIKNIGAGGAEALGRMYNLPFKTGEYLAEKNVLPFGEQLKKYYPKVMIPEEAFSGLKQKLNLGETPQEQTLRGLGSMAVPLKFMKGINLPARVATESAYSSATEGNPFTGPLAFEVGPKAIAKGVELGQKGIKKTIEFPKQIKESIYDYPKYAKQLEIAKQRNQLASENITQQLKNLGETAPTIEQHYKNRLGSALQLNKDPAKSLAQNLNTAVQNIDEQVSNLYKEVIPENTPESILAGTKGYKIYQNVADNLVKKFKPVKDVIEKGIETPDEKSLITGLENVDKLQEISTKDILSYYKTAQQLSNKFNSKAWQEANGLTDAARHEFNNASNYFSDLADKLGEVLNSINPEITTNLEKAKDYFKTYKAPLYERPEYWSTVKKGRITNDILKDTHSEQGGAKLLRSLILDNPEFTKNALARVLREKPENLKNIGGREEYEDFVHSNPDTSIAYHGLKGLEAGVKKIKGAQPEASYIQKLQSSLAGKELSISNKEIENLNSEEAQKVIKIINNEVEKLNKMKRVKNITTERLKALESKTKSLEEKRAKLIKKFGISALGMKLFKYGKKLIL